ncbi:MAG: Crp/Fnr family transcriptional regulator [Pirellulales bacterium]
MAKAQPSGYPSQNALLAKLSVEQFEILSRSFERVELKVPQVLSEPNCPIDYAYFPESGMISIVSLMNDGNSIEVGTIGREGMSGAVLLLESEAMPYQYFVQADGHAQRIKANQLKEAAERSSELRKLILRYQAVFLAQNMQAAACNGLHSVQQRCSRWILMARDRSDSDDISLTHEFLAMMLGVRRASVSEVLRLLQEAGLVSSNRGLITILNREGLERSSCECYRVMVNQLTHMLR